MLKAFGGIGREWGRPPSRPPFISSAFQLTTLPPRRLFPIFLASNILSRRVSKNEPVLWPVRATPQRAPRVPGYVSCSPLARLRWLSAISKVRRSEEQTSELQ